MNIFDSYASYYNLFYQNKDYQSEVKYIESLIQKYHPTTSSILDLGCGTGRHAIELAQNGYKLTGVDRSERMVSQARASSENVLEKSRRPEFTCGDIRDVRLGKEFDLVMSLFHVMSYQTTNKDLVSAIETVNSHLKPGGVFIFDCWYGPGVMTDPPTVRLKRIEDEDVVVTRVAEPTMYVHENLVDVDYLVFVKDKKTGKVEEISEKHTMRYLFYPEVEMLLHNSGFELISFLEFMKDEKPGEQEWNACFICQKQ